MVMRRMCAGAIAIAMLVGCGGGGSEPSTAATDITSAPGGDDAATTNPPEASTPAGLVGVQLQAAGDAVEGLVNADAATDITVAFADASTAVVHVPPAAMESGRPVRVQPVADAAGNTGLVFEPAGAWLEQPITVTFSATGTPLVRFGRTDDELLLGIAALNATGDVLLARLRPIVLATQPDLVDAINTAGDRDTVVGDVYLGRGSDGVDPIDELAGDDEQREADDPDGATEQGPDARAGAVTQLRDPRCKTYADTKEMAELVELARKEPTMTIPECVEVIVRVSGMMDAQIQQLAVSEYAMGERTVLATKQGNTDTIPLQGEEHGWAAVQSVSISGLANGGKAIIDGYFAPLIPAGTPIPDVPAVSADYCQDGNLRDGSLAVTASINDSNMLHVEVQPTPGVWPVTCQDPIPGGDFPSLVWEFLRLVLGMPETAPFVVDTPVTSPVMRLADSLQQQSDVAVRTNADGTVTVSENEMVVHLGLVFSVSFESIDKDPATLG